MHRPQQLLTLLLVACALALRAWVPAGWMPTPGAHSFAIMPCPAAAAGLVGNMGHGQSHHDHSGSGDCFSPLLAGAALPDAPTVATLPSPAPATAEILPTVVAFTAGPAAPPPHSTGPPQLA